MAKVILSSLSVPGPRLVHTGPVVHKLEKLIMRALLAVLFAVIPVSIVIALVIASRDRSILNLGPVLTSDPWFHATLLDAYAGFLIFYVWVAYKEKGSGLAIQVLWFILIMGLGNIATAAYFLLQLLRMKPGDSWEALLLRRTSVATASGAG